jgi:hypothetical protein
MYSPQDQEAARIYLDPIRTREQKLADIQSLYAPAPTPDPGVGLPPEAVAGPPQGDAGAIQQAINNPTGQPLGFGLTVTPGKPAAEAPPALGDLATRDPMEQIREQKAAAQGGPVLSAADTGSLSSLASTVDPMDEVRRQKALKPETLPEVTVTPGQRGAAGPGAGVRPIPDWLKAEMATEGQPEGFNRPSPLLTTNTPEEIAAIRESSTEQFGRAQDQGEAQLQRQDATVRATMAAVDRMEAVDAAMAEKEAARTREIERMENGYRQLLDEAEREPIDSMRYWNRRDTGEKMVAGVAQFLSLIGTGLAQTPDVVGEELRRRADADIEEQKANVAIKQNRAAAEGSLVEMARRRFDSEGAQDAAMKASAYRKIQTQLASFADLAKRPEQKLALEQAIAGFDDAITKQEQQMRLQGEADIVRRMQARAKPAGKKPPRNEAKSLIETLNAQDTVIKKLQRIKELTSSAGDRFPGAENKNRAEALTTSLLFDIKKAEQLGALDKGTVEVFESYIGTPSDLFRSPGSEAKIDQIIQIAEANKSSKAREFQQLQEAETSAPTRGSKSEGGR